MPEKKKEPDPAFAKLDMKALEEITKKVIAYGPSKKPTRQSTGDRSTASRPRP